MTLQLIDPDRLPTSPAFSQVAVAAGTRTVYVSGQVAPETGMEDFAAQARAVHERLAIALEAAGARPADIAKLTTYVVDYQPELLPAIVAARSAVLGEHRPASTLIGVSALARPGLRIEVEAIAVLDR